MKIPKQSRQARQASTHVLRGVILLIGLVVSALCLVALPAGIISDQTGGYRYILAGLYPPAVPFFVALYQAWRLLKYIDRDQVFSRLSVRALQTIKFCALAISGWFSLGMPYVYIVADKDDAPGVVLIGLVIIFASLVIATFAAVLQQLLQTAADLKSEHDLTV